jgi:tetratricopeptide (TPR) repeat protein
MVANADFREIALELGERLYLDRFSEFELIEIAALYIQIDQSELLLNRLTQTFPSRTQAMGAYALLLADQGDSRLAENWIANRQNIPDYILINFYNVAIEKEEYPFALTLARRLQQEFPSPQSEAYYAQVLVKIGRLGEGICLLRNLFATYPNEEIGSIYYSALVSAAKESPCFWEELSCYMGRKMCSDSMTEQLLRDFGYTYLDVLNDIARAREIFGRLALEANSHNEDVKTAVYLFGPNPSRDLIAWVAAGASCAKIQEAALWLQDLAYFGAFNWVISLFEQRFKQEEPSLIGVKTIFAYFDALIYEKRIGELREAIDVYLPFISSVSDLKQLASYADLAVYFSARRFIWERIVCMEPNNLSAWQELARAYFDERNFSATLDSLDRFFDLLTSGCEKNEKLFESLYEYGESCFELCCWGCAWKHYCLSLKVICAACEKTPLMMEIASLIFYRLADRKFLDAAKAKKQLIALQWMCRYYHKASRAPDAAAAYLNLLYDVGALVEGEKFINNEIFAY